MARKQDRFKRVKGLLKSLNGAAPAAGSDAYNFLQFLSGATTHQIKIREAKKLTRAEREKKAWGMLPFNIAPTINSPPDTERWAAPITVRANALRFAIGLGDLDCGYKAVVRGQTKQRGTGYYAALLNLHVVPDGVVAVETSTSAILKKAYPRPANVRGASIPFGRRATTALTDVEEDRRGALTIAAKDGDTDGRAYGVSYSPEVWRTGASDLDSPATNAFPT